MFSSMHEEESKREPSALEADALFQLESMRERATWQRLREKRATFRLMAVFFLFAVLACAAAAFFIFLSPDRVQELRARNPATSSPSPSAMKVARP